MTWGEDFSDAFTGLLQEAEHSVVPDFGLYCYSHRKKGPILNWWGGVDVLQVGDAGGVSSAKWGFVSAEWILGTEGVEGGQRWDEDHWRGAEAWGVWWRIE